MSESRYQDGEYLRRNPDWHRGESRWKADQIRTLLNEHGLAPRRLAEIGCGAGLILSELAAALPDATLEGFDVSPQAIEMARPLEVERLRFHVGSPPRDARYDVVLFIDVIEHVDDPYGFLRGARHLAPRFVMHVPLELSVNALMRPGRLERTRTESGHLHHFTRETALGLLEETGYRVIDARHTAGTIAFPGDTAAARLARLPRRWLSSAAPDLAARLLGGFSLLVLAE